MRRVRREVAGQAVRYAEVISMIAAMRTIRSRDALITLLLSTAAALVLAPSALAAQTSLIAGPVAASPSGYRMVLIAGEGQAPGTQLGGTLTRGIKVSKPKASLMIVFFRDARSAKGRELITQEYIFPIKQSVMTRLRTFGVLDVSLKESKHNYGTIAMTLSGGKLRGAFGFTDPPFRGTSPIPARLITGNITKAFTHSVKPPKTATTPVCLPSGAAEFLAFDRTFLSNEHGRVIPGSAFVISALRGSVTQKPTILLSEISTLIAAPATEVREIVWSDVPSTDFIVNPPMSGPGARVNSGPSVFVETAGAEPLLQGSLSFDGLYTVPLKTKCPLEMEVGNAYGGTSGTDIAADKLWAQFDGPYALGPTRLAIPAGPSGGMEGELIVSGP